MRRVGSAEWWHLRVEVRLPQWGMGMQEGTVIAWLKNEGDRVQRGEALVDIESAKVTATVEAPASGTLARVIVPAGEVIEVRALLAEIETDEGIA